MSVRNLDFLFHPRSVAVIGATEILSILSPRIRTLDGAESAMCFPSKTRAFWNRTAEVC